jgi:methylmalonyl-CoA/ethylmalonyl-CoA epimerase
VAGTGRIYLDHLAVGTQCWADGYPVLVDALGGRWAMGDDAGEFAPCQLAYRDGMHLEIISPGSDGWSGFMRRFLDGSGPGPHHLTFHVPSLDAARDELAALGLSTFGGRDTPSWRESFLHPKEAGLGTLIQLAESDDDPSGPDQPAPDGFPGNPPEPASIAWIGLSAESVDFATALFRDALGGAVAESGAGWRLFSWGPQRRLLVRQSPVEPGAPPLWAVPTGVAHLAVGAAELSPDRLAVARPLDYDPRLGLPVFSVGG